MKCTELKNILQRIDHKGYPAYKDTKGRYEFSGYVLSIDHVQEDRLHLLRKSVFTFGNAGLKAFVAEA